jgi:hypothetical protein
MVSSGGQQAEFQYGCRIENFRRLIALNMLGAKIRRRVDPDERHDEDLSQSGRARLGDLDKGCSEAHR